MSEKIEPALNEWRERLRGMLDGYIDLDNGVDSLGGPHFGTVDVRFGGPSGARDPKSETAALIALLNDSLPDSDPRKITRERINLAREAFDVLDGKAEDDLAVFLDGLESYLPPA